MTDRERSYWERHARHYDQAMWLLGGPLPRMCERVVEAALGAANVLEVGAGTGLVTRALARSAHTVVATDYAAGMVQALRRRVEREGLDNVRCEQADLYALRYQPGSFEVVVAANLLHLVPDLPAALHALRSQLRQRGRLVVPTYCHAETRVSRMLSRALSAAGLPVHRQLSFASLQAAVATASLRVTRAELLPGILPIGYVEAVREDT